MSLKSFLINAGAFLALVFVAIVMVLAFTRPACASTVDSLGDVATPIVPGSAHHVAITYNYTFTASRYGVEFRTLHLTVDNTGHVFSVDTDTDASSELLRLKVMTLRPLNVHVIARAGWHTVEQSYEIVMGPGAHARSDMGHGITLDVARSTETEVELFQ